MRVRRGNNVWPGLVNVRVNGEGGLIDFAIALDDVTFIVDEEQIRDANLAEVHAERIDPEMIEALRIARGDMAGDAFVKSAARKKAGRAGELFFAMTPLLGGSGKHGRAGDALDLRLYLGHKTLLAGCGLLYRIRRGCGEGFSGGVAKFLDKIKRSRMWRERSGRAKLRRSEPLPLRLCRSRRLRRGLWRDLRRSGRRRSGGARLHRVSLIVEADNILGHVDLVRGIHDRRILRRSVQHHRVTVLARITFQHVDHLSADAVDDVTLLDVHVFLEFVALAIKLLCEPLPLFGQTVLFLRAALSTAGIEALLKIIDLFCKVLDLGLARGKLRLEFGGGLLAFRGVPNCRADVDYAYLTCNRGACSRR